MIYLSLTMELMIMGLIHAATPVKMFGILCEHEFKILVNGVMGLLNKVM